MTNFLSHVRAHFHNRLTRLLLPVIALVAMLVLLEAVSFYILSSLRASVNGESQWSKAQGKAVESLAHFAKSGDAADYRKFVGRLAVAEGDLAARLAIDQAVPDLAAARAGLLAAGNHPDDINGMIWLYRYFKHAPHVDRALRFWVEGDALIVRLRLLGERLHAAVMAGSKAPVLNARLARELTEIDDAFRPVEEGFSTELGMASRLTLKLLLLAIFVFACSLLLMMRMFFRRLIEQSEQSQRELALSEERLRLGFQGTNCGLWDWNMVTNRVFYSPWIYKLLEYEDGIMSNREHNFLEMVHPEDRAATQAAGSAHILRGAPYDIEFRIRTRSGKYLWVRSRAEAVRDAEGRAIRMAGSIFDISHLKEVQGEAFIQRELAQVTLAAIADAVIRTDLDGYIDYCNVVAEKLLGLSGSAIRGRHQARVCPIFEDADTKSRIDLVGPVLSGTSPGYANPNLYLERIDGLVVAIDASVASVRDQAGNFFGAVVILHDVSTERQHASQLSHQASHDELTGLINRREFERQLSALLALPASQKARHAIMYLDLDQLKIVNDSGGHAAGDQLIRQLSALLKQRLRDGDLLARLGGDEFGVVIKDCSDEDAVNVAEALRELVFDTRFVWEGKSYTTGLSIGLVSDIEQFESLIELMKVADAACFMAKEKGRNRVHCYRADDHELSLRHREIEWVSRIAEAHEQNRFRLYAQRIVPAASQDRRGQHVELLLRMVDAEGTLIPPMSFIPAAERYNLMPKIDRWVVQAAFGMLAEGFAAGVDPQAVTCAINLSGASIEDEHFLEFIMEQQRQHAIPFHAICFEITETAAIANLPRAAHFIAQLRSVGCSFSLDDFGAGMASFGYLKHLPVDFLKIDGSFVKDMMSNPIDRAMVGAINQIGHVMGKKTIAEFVENDAILDSLKQLGVDYAQGFGIARPEPFHARFLLDVQTARSAAGAAPADCLLAVPV